MTLINLATLEAALGEIGEELLSATIAFTPYAGAKPYARIDGEKLVLPQEILVQFVEGTPLEPLELLPTGPQWCYKVVIEAKAPYRSVTRYIYLGDVESIDWEDLVDVNPKTLVPTPPALAGWAAILLEVTSSVAEIRISTYSANISAVEAENSSLAAELSADEADEAAIEAEGSAALATISEVSASQSASLATQKAAAANTSAASAATSASSAGTSAADSATYATSAANSATTAGASRDAAVVKSNEAIATVNTINDLVSSGILTGAGTMADGDLMFAITDETNNLTWIQITPTGGPTQVVFDTFAAALRNYNLALIDSRIALLPMPLTNLNDMEQVYGITDAANNLTWVQIAPDGRPTKATIDMLASMLNITVDIPPTTTIKATYRADTYKAVSGPDWTGWGDSLMAGAGGGGTTIMTTIRDLLTAAGWTGAMYNYGVGGEKSYDIIGRQGGNPVIATVVGGVIPAAVGRVVLNIKNSDGTTINTMMKQGGGSSMNPAKFNGVTGTVDWSDGTNNYGFTRLTAGVDVPMPYSYPLIPGGVGAIDRRGDNLVLNLGRNNVGDLDKIQEDVAAAILHMTPAVKRYLVGAVLNGSGETPVSTAGINVNNINKALKKTYGRRFVDHRRFLIDYGLLFNGIEPTAQDIADIANDIVPTSLRNDTLHLNAAGYTAAGWFFTQRIIELGWY